MLRDNVLDLLAFRAVAREGSFTRAAATLGVSQSALSHTIRQLEARLGIALLTRTTRAVAPTEAGQRLLNGIGTHFDEIIGQRQGKPPSRHRTVTTRALRLPAQSITHRNTAGPNRNCICPDRSSVLAMAAGILSSIAITSS